MQKTRNWNAASTVIKIWAQYILLLILTFISTAHIVSITILINIHCNIISSLGIVPVSSFLSNLKNVSCDLRHNNLGPKGMHAVARALIHNNYIAELLLCDNAIQPEGSAYVAKLLLENFNITKIDISENEIGSAGAHSIAQVLKENNSLQSINLSENLLKRKDANILAEALKRNSGLRHLDLSCNKFSEEAGLYLGKLYYANF